MTTPTPTANDTSPSISELPYVISISLKPMVLELKLSSDVYGDDGNLQRLGVDLGILYAAAAALVMLFIWLWWTGARMEKRTAAMNLQTLAPAATVTAPSTTATMREEV